MKLQNPNPVGERLWAASPPLAHESRASWIQRLCGSHQYNFAQLTSVACFRPLRMDWDKELPASGWNRLSRMAGMDHDDPRHSTEWLTRMSWDMGRDDFLLSCENKPCYRWCGACFENDSTPYLRWYWRLAFVRVCWIHGSPLSEECAVCGHPFLVDQSRLSNRAALTLAECPRCGCSLVDREEGESQFDRHEQHRYRKAIARCWGFDVQESFNASIGVVGHECEADSDRGQWAHAPTRLNLAPSTGQLTPKMAEDLVVQLVNALHLEGTAVQARKSSNAKATMLAADEDARMRRRADQFWQMLEEEDRVRMREGGTRVFGIERCVAPRPDKLPWHWALPVEERRRLAQSLRKIRSLWRLIRSDPREEKQ